MAELRLASEGGLPGTWYSRVQGQLEQTEQRYKERRRVREGVVHQLRDEHRTPLEVDSSDRVQARLRRLGIDAAEGKLCPDPVQVRSRIVPGTAEPAKLVFERVLGRSDLTSVCFLERGLKVSRTVGRVRINDARGRLTGYGTGFLVSPRLMLTNHHVLGSAAEASHSQIEFNYQSGIDGAALPSVLFELDPATCFITDEKLDYALVAVKERSADGQALSEFGFNRLIEATGKVLLGEYVNIIQHPNGEPKQLALRENQIVDLLDNFTHYMTDTAPGSSGSPVYNDQWEVVALHHMGVPKRSEDGHLLTVDGETWEPGMDPALLAWKANEGVRVSSLVRHIRSRTVSGEAARLRAELLESTANPETSSRPRSGIRKRIATVVARHVKGDAKGGGTETVLDPRNRGFPVQRVNVSEPSVEEPSEGEAPPSELKEQAQETRGVILTGGNATLTLPLRVSIQVSLGDGAALGGSAVEPRPAPALRKAPTRRPIIQVSAHARPEIEEALAELERSRRRPYFDEAASLAAQERYYADVGDEPDYEMLRELVRGTHRTLLRYAPMSQVYPWVDLRPEGMLRSIYSGKGFDPEEFIREDARIDQLRGERFREVLTTEGLLGSEAMAARMDLLEAALPYNCEHVVPQSWFGKREPMKGDLHHLFACESGCNSFRGNTPYFDFPDFEEVEREECGRRVANKFEPTSGKGTVARATLYFLLRYPGEINRTSTEYEESRLAVLLNWHQAEPPSLHERHRNDAIFERQGNRNPFIDHPEWAEHVDFREGLG
ncbi:endonuclease [Hyalangium versicolor]|uniref:endonuclease n=1 Tax=Hyalangium versicolor TaxID=2861190 RepID=UPI001CCA6E94|nr:endonuclease [Hyalangium versicolor]